MLGPLWTTITVSLLLMRLMRLASGFQQQNRRLFFQKLTWNRECLQNPRLAPVTRQ